MPAETGAGIITWEVDGHNFTGADGESDRMGSVGHTFLSVFDGDRQECLSYRNDPRSTWVSSLTAGGSQPLFAVRGAGYDRFVPPTASSPADSADALLKR